MGLAFTSNVSFAIMVSIGGVARNFLFNFLYKKTKGLSRKMYSKKSYFQGMLIQHVAFFKYLKATGVNFHYGRELKSTITDIEYIQRKIGVLASLLNGWREPLTILVVVLVIILQIKWMNADLGTVILSLLFLYRALTFLMALQDSG